MTNNRDSNKVVDILQKVVFPCSRGTYLFSERPSLEGVHSYLCAKEINELLEKRVLSLSFYKYQSFKFHKEGVNIVKSWANHMNLLTLEEVDISIGIADVLVYGDDIGIFEIGTTRPTKMLLLLKYIAQLNGLYTVHLWPYQAEEAIVFQNWQSVT